MVQLDNPELSNILFTVEIIHSFFTGGMNPLIQASLNLKNANHISVYVIMNTDANVLKY